MLREQASGPQPTVASALGALDLDRLMRVVGERVAGAAVACRKKEAACGTRLCQWEEQATQRRLRTSVLEFGAPSHTSKKQVRAN